MDLQALKIIGSATTRRRVLGGGLLSERDASCPVGKLLLVSSGSPAGARPTGLLAVLGVMFLTFTSHLPSRKNTLHCVVQTAHSVTKDHTSLRLNLFNSSCIPTTQSGSHSASSTLKGSKEETNE
jgi:hypothetical protein